MRFCFKFFIKILLVTGLLTACNIPINPPQFPPSSPGNEQAYPPPSDILPSISTDTVTKITTVSSTKTSTATATKTITKSFTKTPTKTLTRTATQTTAPIIVVISDFTPPTVSNVTISPTTLQEVGCGSPDSFTISGKVTDASGILQVRVDLTEPTGTHAEPGAYLTPVGGDIYQAVVQPHVQEDYLSNLGIWIIRLHALDNSSNHNEADVGPWEVTVVCIG